MEKVKKDASGKTLTITDFRLQLRQSHIAENDISAPAIKNQKSMLIFYIDYFMIDIV